ncbi:hypothetical protein ACG3RN_05240 [Pseudomonas aeruginosa]
MSRPPLFARSTVSLLQADSALRTLLPFDQPARPSPAASWNPMAN